MRFFNDYDSFSCIISIHLTLSKLHTSSAIGSRLPRNGAMIAQNQIFGQGQPMSHQAQNQVHIPCQVPVHTQLSHQQHLIQSYKPQMTQAHQLQISQNLGQGQVINENLDQLSMFLVQL
jgi:hypothetical protein